MKNQIKVGKVRGNLGKNGKNPGKNWEFWGLSALGWGWAFPRLEFWE